MSVCPLKLNRSQLSQGLGHLCCGPVTLLLPSSHFLTGDLRFSQMGRLAACKTQPCPPQAGSPMATSCSVPSRSLYLLRTPVILSVFLLTLNFVCLLLSWCAPVQFSSRTHLSTSTPDCKPSEGKDTYSLLFSLTPCVICCWVRAQ